MLGEKVVLFHYFFGYRYPIDPAPFNEKAIVSSNELHYHFFHQYMSLILHSLLHFTLQFVFFCTINRLTEDIW